MNIPVNAGSRVSVLIFKNIPDKIMVLIVGRKVIMAAAMDTDKRYYPGVYCLQGFTMTDRYKLVFSSMNNVGMAFYLWNPAISS